MSDFLEDLERWLDAGETRAQISERLADYNSEEVIYDLIVLLENLREGRIRFSTKVEQKEDYSHLSHPDRFSDPKDWPSCPLCGTRANSNDGNHWNIFSCPWHGKFALGAGPIPNGMVMIKRGSRR